MMTQIECSAQLGLAWKLKIILYLVEDLNEKKITLLLHHKIRNGMVDTALFTEKNNFLDTFLISELEEEAGEMKR